FSIFNATTSHNSYTLSLHDALPISFSREQLEAAKASGMTPLLTFRRIMLPQMLLTSLPGLVNEISFLVKASPAVAVIGEVDLTRDRKSTRLNSSHVSISYAVFCSKK